MIVEPVMDAGQRAHAIGQHARLDALDLAIDFQRVFIMCLGKPEASKLCGDIAEMTDDMSGDERGHVLFAPTEICRLDIETLGLFELMRVAAALALGHQGAHKKFWFIAAAGQRKRLMGKLMGVIGTCAPPGDIDPVYHLPDILLHDRAIIAGFRQAGDGRGPAASEPVADRCIA